MWLGCGIAVTVALVWLWRRAATAAPIRPLAWELPKAVGAALKSQKKRKKKRERERERVSGERGSRKKEQHVQRPGGEIWCIPHALWFVIAETNVFRVLPALTSRRMHREV